MSQSQLVVAKSKIQRMIALKSLVVRGAIILR
jgi:hypothetical protein